MPNRVNILPNLRVDVQDLQDIEQYAETTIRNQLEKLVISNLAAIQDGFRVEIANQGTSPGLFAVHNGVAIDRYGQIVNNENDYAAQRSQTLIADATYFVEVEFVTDLGVVDAKAFWDPSFDNGVDPSGDVRTPGREFSQNVATRIIPDWRIVTPISITGFDRDTDPNSLRIPVAVLTVSGGGGVITGGTTNPARTVTAEAAGVAVLKLKGLDTRLFPDSFPLRIAPATGSTELITVSSNDRENGILTLSLATAFAHAAGTRLVDESATPVVFLEERPVVALPTAGTEDARSFMFRGDETRGGAVAQDPESNTGRADISIKNLKDEIDFLASQLRELKFGGLLDSEVGNVAPATAFNALPRYYEEAGNLVGSRSITVSVGDGVNTWGDFNTLQSGGALAALNAATAVVVANGGGIIYVKAGTYNVATPWVIPDLVTVVGDGNSVSTINATGATAAVSITGAVVRMRHIGVTVVGGTYTHSVDLTNEFHTFENVFFGAGILGSGGVARCNFINCLFNGTGGNAAFEVPTGITNECFKFTACTFTAAAGVGSKCFSAGDADDYNLTDCRFDRNGTPTTGNTIEFDGGTNINVRGCTIAVPQDDSGINLLGAVEKVRISDCFLVQATTNVAQSGFGVCLTSTNKVRITSCEFEDCDYGICIDDITGVSVIGCSITAPTASRGRFGIAMVGAPTVENLLISGCTISDLDADVFSQVIGIVVRGNKVRIVDNLIQNIGGLVRTNSNESIGIEADAGLFDSVIANNVIQNVQADLRAWGVLVTSPYQFLKITGNTIGLIGSSLSADAATAYAEGIRIESDGEELHIDGNTIAGCGNSAHNGSPAGTHFPAAISVGSDNQVHYNVSICNNQVLNYAHNVTHAGIYIQELERAVINGNTLIGNNFNDTGRAIHGNSPDGTFGFLSQLSISNNVIRGFGSGWLYGIFLDLDQTPVNGNCCFAINGNVITDTDGTAIRIVGEQTFDDRSSALMIANNVIHTFSQDAVPGMDIDSMVSTVISGNIVRALTTNTSIDRIVVSTATCDHTVVVGNLIERVALGGSHVVKALTVNDIELLINSNMVLVEDGGCISANGVASITSGNFCRTNDGLFSANFNSRSLFDNSGPGTPTPITDTSVATDVSTNYIDDVP